MRKLLIGVSVVAAMGVGIVVGRTVLSTTSAMCSVTDSRGEKVCIQRRTTPGANWPRLVYYQSQDLSPAGDIMESQAYRAKVAMNLPR